MTRVAAYNLSSLTSERRKRKEQEKAREELHARHKGVIDRIREYDPDEERFVYTRFHTEDLSTFDIDEESPLGPMRYTGKIHQQRKEDKLYMCNSANVLSVNIVSSDGGFPINVYGTVTARESLDCKCIHLFRRFRDDCRLIDAEITAILLLD